MQQSETEVTIVAKTKSPAAFNLLDNELSLQLRRLYPKAVFEVKPALNIFEQLFRTTEPALQMMIYGSRAHLAPSLAQIDSIKGILRKANIPVESPSKRERIQLEIDQGKLLHYGVESGQLIRVLKMYLNDYDVGVLHSEQSHIPIILGNQYTPSSLDDLLSNASVINQEGIYIPIKDLVSYRTSVFFASLFIGKDGPYVPLVPSKESHDIPNLMSTISNVLPNEISSSTRFAGTYFKNKSYLSELTGIVVIAIFLLFFILAAQFESLQQPFIVMLTMIFGIAGALITLYLSGSSLNIMSSIGLIVLIGLLDNDSILKLETMNRSKRQQSMIDIVRMGGKKRLQSQLMTYFTTVLGLLPILWSSGLGAELQRPLALAVIGGMTFGLLTSWTFLPLTYYWLYKGKSWSSI